MYLLNKVEFLERLEAHVIEVHFTKASGEQRRMNCTLRADILPPQKDIEESTTNHANSNPERMIVWDVDRQGWRSFRLDSVNAVLTPTPDEE